MSIGSSSDLIGAHQSALADQKTRELLSLPRDAYVRRLIHWLVWHADAPTRLHTAPGTTIELDHGDQVVEEYNRLIPWNPMGLNTLVLYCNLGVPGHMRGPIDIGRPLV